MIPKRPFYVQLEELKNIFFGLKSCKRIILLRIIISLSIVTREHLVLRLLQ